MAESVQRVVEWDDINFACVAAPHPDAADHCLGVRVYRTRGRDEGGLWYEGEHWDKAGEAAVRDREEARLFLSGTWKWDGCANFRFDAQDGVMLHTCSKAEAAGVGALLLRLYDLAAEMIPHWDGD